MDHYRRLDRLFNHVGYFQVQNRWSDRRGDFLVVAFILWTFLELVFYRVHDIQMFHTRKSIPNEYKVLYHHPGRKKSDAGMVECHHPNSGLQGILARSIDANIEIMHYGT